MIYGTIIWKAAPDWHEPVLVGAALYGGAGYYYLLSIVRHRHLRSGVPATH